MIAIKEFYDIFYDLNIDFFITYFDNDLTSFYNQINESKAQHYQSAKNKSFYKNRHIQNNLVVDESNAIGLAMGYAIASAKIPVIYLNDKSFENCLGTLNVFNEINFPAFFIIFTDDQRKNRLIKFLKTQFKNIDYVDDENTYEEKITNLHEISTKKNEPSFLFVNKNSFEQPKNNFINNPVCLNESFALEYILSFIKDKDVILTSNKAISKFVYNHYKNNNKDTSNLVFFNNSYSQLPSIALGLSQNTTKKIYCIDSLSNFYANAGGVLMGIEKSDRNFKYIIIDDTELNQNDKRTPINSINIKKIFKAIGIKNIIDGYSASDIQIGMLRLEKEKAILIVRTSPDLLAEIKPEEVDFENNFKEIQRFIFIE